MLRVNSCTYCHQPIGKKELREDLEQIEPIEVKDQSAETLSSFDNSNEIQKQYEYPT